MRSGYGIQSKKIFVGIIFLLLAACNKAGHIGIDPNDPKAPLGGVAAGPGVALQLIGPASVSVGTCQKYDIQIVDVNGLVAASFPALTSFNVSVPIGGTAALYTDATCTIAGNTSPVSVSGSGSIYIKDAVREFVTMSASTSPVAMVGSRTIQFTAGAPASLDITVNPSNPTNVCVPVTVKPIDISGNASPVHPGVQVTLSLTGIAQAALFSDAGCLNLTSSALIPSGADYKVFYVQSAAIGNATINASSGSLTPDSANVAFVAGTAPQIVMSGPTGNVTSGVCALVKIESERFDGTDLIALGASIPVSLNVVTGAGVQFYSDSTCAATITNTSIAIGQFSTNVFVKTAQAPQTITVAGTSPGFSSVPTNINYVPVAPSLVRIQGTPATLPAGQCGLGQVALLDQSSQPAFVTANTNVNLSAGANSTQTDFFATNDCSGAPVSVVAVPMCNTIGACQNTVGFSFRPKKVGSLVITPSATSLTSISAAVNVTTPTGSPVSLRLTRLTDPVTTDTCVKYRVETIDNFGNLINMAADFVLNASATSTSGAGMFFSDLNCATLTSTITILSGSSSREFTFRDPKVETVTLTLSGTPGPVVQDTLNIGSGVPAKLVFNGVPASVSAGRCSPAITVIEKDLQDNVTTAAAAFTLSATNGVGFYTDVNCTQGMAQMTIPAGLGSSAPFYFAGPNSGNTILTATAFQPASITVPATASVALNAGSATHIGLSCSAGNLANNTCPAFGAGVCQPVYVTNFDDTNAKYIPVGASIPVTMSSTASGSVVYSNSTCTTALTAPITLNNALNPAVVYVKNTVAQTFSVTGTPSTGAAGSTSLTTNPGVPFKWVIASNVGPSSFFTNTCAGPYQASVQDQYGNASPVANDTVMTFASSTLAGNGLPINMVFSSANNCSASTPTLAATTSSAQFYIKSPTTDGSLNLRVSGGALNTSDIRGLTISPSANVVMIANNTQIASINFGTVAANSSSLPITVTLKNLSATETANMAAIANPTAPFEKVASGTTCPAGTFSLSPNQTCDVVLRFSPTTVNTFTGTFSASYTGATTGATGTTTINLSGVSVAPTFNAIYLSASAMNFGTVNSGSSLTLSINLVNPNNYGVNVTGLNISTNFSAVVKSPCGNSFPFTIAANGTCPVDVTFTPPSAGSYSGQLTMSYTNPNTSSSATTSSVALSGTGVGQSTALSLNPSGYQFTNVPIGTTVGPVQITVSNGGTVPATSLSLSGVAAPFSVTMGTCPTTLVAGASCTLNVSYSPTASGPHSQTVTLNYGINGGAATSSATITLTGTTTAGQPTNLTITPSTWDFGTVQAGLPSSAKTFTITNTGGQAADSISLNNLGTSFQVNYGTCTGTLAAGASCTVSVYFAPNVPGSYVAFVTLQYRNAVSGQYSNIGSALTLTGAASQGTSSGNLLPDVSAINYGSVRAITGSAYRYTLISNTGGTAVTNLAISKGVGYDTYGFTASLGTCGTTLGAGQSCYVLLGVSPRYVGYASSSVAVTGTSNGAAVKTIDIQVSVYGF